MAKKIVVEFNRARPVAFIGEVDISHPQWISVTGRLLRADPSYPTIDNTDITMMWPNGKVESVSIEPAPTAGLRGL